MRMVSLRKLVVVGVAAALAVGGLVLTSDSDQVVEAVSICSTSGTDMGGGGEYHPIAPVRAYDSRTVNGGQPHTAGQSFDLDLLRVAGMPSAVDANSDGLDDNVLAIAINVTSIGASGPGHVKTTPKGSPFSISSISNFSTGLVAPTATLARPGQGGLTSFVAEVNSAQVIVDVFGWVSSCNYTAGARFMPLGPTRLYDSRVAKQPLGPGNELRQPVRGQVGVPNDPNVVAVVVNLTGVNNRPDSAPTHIAAYPEDAGNPANVKTSNLNLVPGQIRANMAIVPIGADGKIRVFNFAGTTNVVIDVVGYMMNGVDAATNTGRIVPLATHFRAIDTREAAFGAKPLGPGAAEPWSFDKTMKSVKVDGNYVGTQSGMFANFTPTGVTRLYPTVPIPSTFLSIYPSKFGGQPPTISNANLGEGMAVPNMAFLKFGQDSKIVGGNGKKMCETTSCVSFFNAYGYVHYVVDVQAVVLT